MEIERELELELKLKVFVMGEYSISLSQLLANDLASNQ